jgi:ubiquinone/menaquinone biosynthesis C-methylase UbiE
VEPLLHDARVAAGDNVLDLACGTGVVGRAAKLRVGALGKVVGVDASPAMIDTARKLSSDIDWRQGDAGALPLERGEQFNVVVCQQGMQFFPDRPGAAREMRRALLAGGRLAASTWCADEESPSLHRLRRVAERHLGVINDRRHSLPDAGELESLMRDAGFRDVRSTVVTRTIYFDNGADFVRLNAMALLGMSEAAGKLDEAERERAMAEVVRESVAEVAPGGGGFSYELGANTVIAQL